MIPFRLGNKRLKISLLQEIYDTPEYVYTDKVDIGGIFAYIKLDNKDVSSSNFEEIS